MILFPNVFIRLCINRVYANPLEVLSSWNLSRMSHPTLYDDLISE